MTIRPFRCFCFLTGVLLLGGHVATAQHLSMGQVFEVFRAPHERREVILKANDFQPDATYQVGGKTCLRFSHERLDLNSQAYVELVSYCPGSALSYGTYSPDHATDLKFQLLRRYEFEDKGTLTSAEGRLKNRYQRGALIVETHQTKDNQRQDLWLFQVYEAPTLASPLPTQSVRRGTDLDDAPPGPAEFKGQYHALLIGVNDYADPSLDDLRFPVQDVARLRAVLTGRYTFEDSRVRLLTNPTRRAIVRALDELRQRVGPDDNVLIFYAGHGRNNAAKTQGYWLPADAESAYSDGWLSNSTVKDQLQEFGCRHVLVVSDACFSGGILRARDGGNVPTRAVRQLYQNPSRKAMTSSNDTPVPDNSPFLRYLLDRLEKNEKPHLPSLELYGSLVEAVGNNSATGQVPQYGVIPQTGDQGGDFIFIRRTGK